MAELAETTQLTESAPLLEAAGKAKGRRFRARLIAGDIQGSSGYYSAEMLRRDGPRVFVEGLPVFMDHPSTSEAYERPERSVRDLAGRLASTAVYERDGLYADVEVYPHVAPIIEAMSEHIGMSIRAAGMAEPSEDEAVRGPVITALTEAMSVDFVTAAGAGGKVVRLLEAARDGRAWTVPADGDVEVAEARNIGHWLESRLHLALTQFGDEMFGDGQVTRDERIAMSSAVGDALEAFARSLEDAAPQLYQRDLYDGPPEPESAEVAETITPAPPAPTLEEHRMSGSTQPGTPPSGAPTTEVSEAAQLRTELAETKQRLAEAELKVAQLGDNARELEETKRALEESKRENLRLLANDTARSKAVETLAESTLPETAHERVIESVTGKNVPLNDGGALDEAALVKNIKAAIEAERKYLTRFAEEAGIGQVRGLGESGEPQVDVESELGGIFKSLGMSESAAQVAAKGRG